MLLQQVFVKIVICSVIRFLMNENISHVGHQEHHQDPTLRPSALCCCIYLNNKILEIARPNKLLTILTSIVTCYFADEEITYMRHIAPTC